MTAIADPHRCLLDCRRRPDEPLDVLIPDKTVISHRLTGVIHAQGDGLTTVALKAESTLPDGCPRQFFCEWLVRAAGNARDWMDIGVALGEERMIYKTGFCSITVFLLAVPVLAASGNGEPKSANAPTTGLNQINHILFLAQENRSFDHYFGYMRGYWAANGYPDQSFDGLPEFNPKSGIPPLYGPPLTNPSCD